MILGFDSGCPLPSLGSPRFDEEAVNRAKGGRSPRWIYSQSFSNKKLYSQSTQFFAFAPLIHNNIVFFKKLQVEMQAIHCKAPNRSVFLQRISINKSAPGFFLRWRLDEINSRSDGAGGMPYMSLLWCRPQRSSRLQNPLKRRARETSKLANTLEPLQGSSWLLYTQTCQLKDKRFDNMGSPPILGLKRRRVDSIPALKKCALEQQMLH